MFRKLMILVLTILISIGLAFVYASYTPIHPFYAVIFGIFFFSSMSKIVKNDDLGHSFAMTTLVGLGAGALIGGAASLDGSGNYSFFATFLNIFALIGGAGFGSILGEWFAEELD